MLNIILITDNISGDLIVRGCVTDLSEDDRKSCSDPKYKLCSLCDDRDNCNVYGGANLTKAFSGIVLIVLSALLKVL